LAHHVPRDCSYEAILRRLRASTGHRKFDVVPAPVIADRLISFARFGNLPVRFTFGQMVFATDKLKEEGFRPRFGLENLYREAIDIGDSRVTREERADPSATSDALGEWPDTGGYRLDRRFNRHVETIKHGHGDQARQHRPFDTDSMRRGPRQHDE
jgi:hypothetical protein